MDAITVLKNVTLANCLMNTSKNKNKKVILSFYQYSWEHRSKNTSDETRYLDEVYTPDKSSLKQDMFNLFSQYLNNRKTQQYDNELAERFFTISKIESNQEKRIISGLLKAGKYGENRDIIEKGTNANKGQIKADQSPVTEFYFLLFIPKQRKTGTLILERTYIEEVKSLKQDFQKDFNLFFQESVPNHKVEITAALPSKIRKEYWEDGKLKELTFQKEYKPTDKSDLLVDGTKMYTMNTSIHPGKSQFFPSKILKELNSKVGSNFTEVCSYIGVDKDYDSLKLEIHSKKNGDKKTFLFTATEHYISPNISIEVPHFTDKHIAFADINEKAIEILEEV